LKELPHGPDPPRPHPAPRVACARPFCQRTCARAAHAVGTHRRHSQRKTRHQAETALRLGRYFGNDPRFWINLQAQYDLALAMRDVGARVAREVETAA
jgi:plasmid maintenance system antidote protein VapI